MGKNPGKTRPSAVATGIDRKPLYNEDAERGMLGCILLDSTKVLDFCVEKQIVPESFYIPAHQTIFQIAQNMSLENRPVDALTLADRLQTTGQLEEIGGAVYLDQLLHSVPTAAHAEYYIDIVRQNHLLRSIVNCARSAESECYNTEESADQLLGKVEQSFFDLSEHRHGSLRMWSDIVKSTMVTIDHILNAKTGISGIPTGYIDLDDKLMGLHRGDLIILAARPSMGKTSLAMNIAENIAMGNTSDGIVRPVGIFSLEMSQEQLVMRMLCSRAGISSHSLAKGFITPSDHAQLAQAADALTKAPIYLDDTSGLDILELRARARRMKKKYGIELFIIDYLQLLHAKDRRNDGRQQEIASISGSLKGMAKELNVPALVLSQLNRAPELRGEGKPRLADLRESGAIEQDADVVMFLHDPNRGEEESSYQQDIRDIDLIVEKNRQGERATIALEWNPQTLTFSAPDYRGIPEP